MQIQETLGTSANICVLVVWCAASVIWSLITVCNHNLFVKLSRPVTALPEVKLVQSL